MRRIMIFAALAAGSALIAAPAAAQTVTGTVDVTGTVGDKCIVTNTGAPTGNDFGGTVNLGALDDSTTGLLKASSDLSTAFGAAGASQLSYRVVCTTPSTAVSVKTDPLVTGAAVSTGYANTVNFNSNVAFSLVGGAQTVSNDSLIDATTTTATFADRMAAGATNILVTADNFRTPAATDVLLAGTYSGKITISIAPSS